MKMEMVKKEDNLAMMKKSNKRLLADDNGDYDDIKAMTIWILSFKDDNDNSNQAGLFHPKCLLSPRCINNCLGFLVHL